jgi:hypothetical protein
MTSASKPVFPVWVAEVGADVTVWYNTFGAPQPTRRQRIEIASIIKRLRQRIRDGRISPHAVVGWGGRSGARIPNAVDTADARAMRFWFDRAFTIVLSRAEMAEPASVATDASRCPRRVYDHERPPSDRRPRRSNLM